MVKGIVFLNFGAALVILREVMKANCPPVT